MAIKTLAELPLEGKKVLMRVDYNVPLSGTTITDDHRIAASVPSVEAALAKGAKLVLCSHLGKAKGPDPALSLAPAAKRLSELIGKPVAMAPDCLGPEVAALVEAMKPGEVLMLENLRFHPGETKNDPEFSKAVAQGFDVYIDDAFGVAHRPHASVVGFPKVIGECGMGLLLQKEWDYLGQALETPKRPCLAISGGAKVSSKLGILKNLLGKVDAMIIGGAMANTFIAAMGFSVGKSLVETELFADALAIMEEAKKRGVAFYLPVDFVYTQDVGKPLADMLAHGVAPYQNIPADAAAMDIGPASAALFSEVVCMASTVVWNGPMGAFENRAFSEGSMSVGRAVGIPGKVTIVGGGDTDALVHQAGLADAVSFISTGGGSFMEFMEGKELPAFQALRECSK